jgi:GTPase KRas protein
LADTAGQEEYSAFRDSYMKAAEGYIILYSVLSRTSFEQIIRFRTQITRLKESQNVPLVIVGNKGK